MTRQDKRLRSFLFTLTSSLLLIVGGVGLIRLSVNRGPQRAAVREAARPVAATPAPSAFDAAHTEASLAAAPAAAEVAGEDPAKQAMAFARTYREGKSNIHFDEKEFIRQISNQRTLASIRAALADTRSLDPLPANVRMVMEHPEAVLDRMGLIDLAEGIWQYGTEPQITSSARVLLEDTLRRSPPRDKSALVKKVFLGESYDSLTALVRNDRERGLAVYRSLTNPEIKRQLRTAIVLGLQDSGVPKDEATHIAHAASQDMVSINP